MPVRFFARMALALTLAALPAVAYAQSLPPGTSVFYCLGSTSTSLNVSGWESCQSGTPQNAGVAYTLSLGVNTSISNTGGLSKPAVGRLYLQKPLDRSSTLLKKSLFLKSSSPLNFSMAISMTLPNASGTGLSNLTIEVDTPVVTALSESINDSGGTPMENVTIAYKSLKIVDNSTSPPTVTTWTAN